ncbi:hypothetical protein ACFWII_36805 [Streptomyces sp. NPDC127063]|uniref:hypothetical protein n=1 Tax=Streptomyces sp. NPDC127063 TaxID=3347123 RepID=UPI003654806C
MSAEEIPEPVPARPWRPEDGPRPKVTTWAAGSEPALMVWSHGRWRYAPVMARQDWADGRVFYQVHVDLLGDNRVSHRMYQWPQPGLRTFPGSERRTGPETGDLPRPPRRPSR